MARAATDWWSNEDSNQAPEVFVPALAAWPAAPEVCITLDLAGVRIQQLAGSRMRRQALDGWIGFKTKATGTPNLPHPIPASRYVSRGR